MIHRCSVPGLNAALKPAEFRFCSWACSCWWLTFSAEVPHWGTKPCSPWSVTWQIASTRKGGGKGDSGSLHPAGSRVGSMGVRCDVAQLAVYSCRHGRIGALGHCYGGCKRLCSVARGGKLCWAPMCLLAQLSWAVLWSLVPGSRGTCQDMILLGTVPVVCMFPSTWSVSKTSVGALVPQEGLFVN